MEEEVALEEAESRLGDEFETRLTTDGMEAFHAEVGEYWRPAHLMIRGDTESFENLELISSTLDEFELKVFGRHGHSFCESDQDGYAIITHVN